MYEKLYEVCKDILEDEEEYDKFSKMETADEIYEYFSSKISELSEEAFEDFIIEILKKYNNDQKSVSKLDEDALENVAGGFNLGTKFASVGLAAMALLSSVGVVGATNEKMDSMESSISVSQSLNEKKQSITSGKFDKLKKTGAAVAGVTLGTAVLTVAAMEIKSVMPSIKQAILNRNLLSAVEKMDTKSVESLIKKGANVNYKNRKGYTPLELAINKYCNLPSHERWQRDGYYFIAETLIKNGADVKHTNISIAQRSNEHYLLKLLLKNGAKIDNSEDNLKYVYYLYKDSDRKLFELMLKSGAYIEDGKFVIEKAVDYNDFALVKEVLNRGVKVSGKALIKAWENNNNSILDELFKHIEPKSKSAGECLVCAARVSATKLVKKLLDLGVDVNSKDGNGRTAVFVCNSLPLLKELLNRGADINARDNYGGTPLTDTIWNTEPNYRNNRIKYLLECGADANIPGNFNITVLEACVGVIGSASEDTVRLLLEKGRISKDNKERAANAARKNGHWNKLDLIMKSLEENV